jgi:hypothetical protein
MASPLQSESLVAKVARAFADVPYPGDDDLTGSTYGEEPAALVEAFKGKNEWRELDARFLDQAPDGWASALSFFSANALHFYLPAYLIADLKGQLMTVDPALRLCMSLTPMGGAKKIAKQWGGGTLGDRARSEFGTYTDNEVSAIVDYLRWRMALGNGHELTIEQALTNYWLPREAELSARVSKDRR